MRKLNYFFIFICFIPILHALPAKELFEYSTDNTQFLDYSQKRSISTINMLVSKYISPLKIIDYKIEVKEPIENNTVTSVNHSTIIFYGNPVKILEQKEPFSNLTISLITKALELDVKKLNSKSYQWIIAGIYRKYIYLMNYYDHIPERGAFPAIHYLLISGKKLSSEKIINSSLNSSYDIGYDIFAEESEILLNTIAGLKEGRKIIPEYLKVSENNPFKEKYYPVFKEILNKILKNKDKNFFNEQLNKTAFYYSINNYMPAPESFCIKKFKEYENITFKEKDKKTLAGCNLENIAINIEKMETPGEIIDKLIQNLQNDQYYFPYYLNLPIRNLLTILLELKRNASYLTADQQLNFDNRISQCIKDFYTGVSKQKKLKELLNNAEIQTLDCKKLFNKYFPVIKEHNIREREFSPELNRYLEKLDHQYN